jgi:hypothetical protein
MDDGSRKVGRGDSNFRGSCYIYNVGGKVGKDGNASRRDFFISSGWSNDLPVSG